MTRVHDDVCRSYWQHLMQTSPGRFAWEAGVPGGRVDIVRLDADDNWVELYEIKVREPEAGIAQLHRYARAAGFPRAALTLVVPPHLATRALSDLCDASRVRLEAFAGSQLPLISVEPIGEHAFLPYHDPKSQERATALVMEWHRQHRRWWLPAKQEPAAHSSGGSARDGLQTTGG